MTTVINGSDNSASTPALTGTDTDTGVFFPSANNMALSTGGTERMRVDSSGNVGIGTSSPAEKLDLVGNTDTTLRVRASSDTALILNETTPNKTWKIKSSDGTLAFQYSSTAYNSGFSSKAFITTDGYLRMASGSGGIQFNGDTAAANALDDYEEGTFTPVLDGTAGASPVVSYSVRSGYYTKIGNVVNASLYITVSSISGGSGNIRISGLPFTVANNSNNNGICTILMSGVDIPAGVSYVGSYTNPNTTELRPLCTVDSSGWVEIPISAVSSGDSFLIGATYFA